MSRGRAALAVATLLLFLAAQVGAKEVEVMHFWVSPSERSAIETIKEAYEKQGGTWVNNIASDELDLRVFLSDRILKGFTPTIYQWHGGNELQYYAEQGWLSAYPPSIFTRPDSIVPFVLDNVSYKKDVVAIPLGVHSENWAWYNLHVYEKLGLAVPTSWEEFLAQAPIIEKAGYTPLAIGSSMWQHQLLFNVILAGKIGYDSYLDLYVTQNPERLNTEAFRDTIGMYRSLRQYMSSGPLINDWIEATHLVASGKAAVLFMGDWAKPALNEAGLRLGKDYTCRLAPQTEDMLIAVIDVLALAKTEDRQRQDAQQEIAKIATSPQVQKEYNRRKGSLPIMHLQDEAIDACTEQARRALASDRLLPSMSMLWPNKYGSLISELLLMIEENPAMSAGDIQGIIYRKATDEGKD